MKKLLILLFLLVLLAPVYAQTVSVSVTTPESIYAGRVAEFDITIENTGKPDWFSVAIFGAEPGWVTIEKSSIYIESGKKAVTKAWISPSENAQQATYKYNILVSGAGENLNTEKEVLISVLQKSLVVIDSFEITCTSCNPGEDVSVSANVRNVGSKTLSGVDIYFYFLGSKRVVNLGTVEVGSEKNVVTNFFIDKLEHPGVYTASAELLQEKTVLDTKTFKFSVKGISNIVSDESENNNLLGRYVTIEINNSGNMVSDYHVASSCLTGWYGTYSGPEYTVSGDMCLWSGSIGPGEKKVITYSEVYWISIIVLLVLIFSVVYFYLQNNALSIKKNIMQKHAATEGRVYSISIEVSNKGKSVEDIIVHDTVPSMFEVEKGFETIKPVIKKTEKGTALVWKVGRLKSGEVRILHYKVKTLIGLLGTYKMPIAKLAGKLDSKHIVKMSNVVEIYGPKIK